MEQAYRYLIVLYGPLIQFPAVNAFIQVEMESNAEIPVAALKHYAYTHNHRLRAQERGLDAVRDLSIARLKVEVLDDTHRVITDWPTTVHSWGSESAKVAFQSALLNESDTGGLS